MNPEKQVFNMFKGYEIYLVGGTVRDRLLGINTNDFDFATNALPEQTKKILEDNGFKPHTVGWAFGTVGFLDKDNNEFHITTYRRDEDYQRDNRKPVVEWGKTILEDLTRRDFTINAIAQKEDGSTIDPFNGLISLNIKIIDTPIDANQAFSDDPLRMLRAVRFRARLGFNYSDRVKQALSDQAHRLLILSKERVLEEMSKILVGDNVDVALNDLLEFKLINYFIPELTVLATIEQNSKFHHKNVWLHTVGVVKNIRNNEILRWAALFHDIGKPYVKTDKEEIHFYRHEEVSELIAESILRRLNLPTTWIKTIKFLIRNHMRCNLYETNWSDTAIRRLINESGVWLDFLIELSRADITSHNPNTIQSHIDRLNDLSLRVDKLKCFRELKCPISGEDIMQRFNLTPGPQVGVLKNKVIQALLSGELKLGESAEVYIKYLEEHQ